MLPEDRKAYAIATDPRQQTLAKKAPAWQDTLPELMYQQASSYPEGIPDIFALGLDILAQEGGAAANRRYGDTLDPYYRNSDGSLDETKLAEDNFILELEGAYYGSRGQVPMAWFMDHIEDLALLGPKHADVVEQMYAYDRTRQAISEAEGMQEERFMAQIERGMNTSGYGRAKVETLFNGYTEMVDQVRQDLTEWSIQDKISYLEGRESFSTKAGQWVGDWFRDTPAPPTTPEEVASLDARFSRARAKELAPEYTQGAFSEEFTETTFGDIPAAGLDLGSLQRMFENEETGLEGTTAFVMELFGGVGSALNLGADGIGWLSSPIWSDQRGRNFQTRYDSLFGGDISGREQEAVYKEQLEQTLGMTDDEFIMQMGLVPAMDMFAALPQINPEEFNLLMAMAGGDEELAEFMLVDMVQNDPERRAAYIEQAQAVRDEAAVQLTQMRDENFTLGDALLDLLAMWGEGTENLATSLLTGGEYLFTGKGNMLGTAEFWNDVRENDTPSGVFGLEGTLIGLGIDLVGGAAVDPLTYIFGPRLSSAGRAGATTIDDAVRIASSPASRQMMEEIVMVGRGNATGHIAYQVPLDTMAVTGLDQLMMAASRGSVKPITGVRPYLAKFGRATDDVAYNVIDEFIDPEALSRRGIDKATDRIKREGLTEPIELTVNPDTGAVALTRGADDAVALQLAGIDAIPTTIKLDTSFGVAISDDVAEWSAKLGVQDGRMSVDALTRLRRYDFDAEMQTSALPDSPHPLVEDIAANGVTKPLEVIVDISSSPPKVQLMNGNHRLAAAKAAGQPDVPVNVRIKRRDLDKIPGVDDGRAAPFKAAEQFDSPIAVDDGIVTAEWAKGITAEGKPLIDDALHARPRDTMGRNMIFGMEDDTFRLMEDIYQRHLMMGGDPISGNKTAMATSVGHAVGEVLRTAKPNTVADKISRFVTPVLANVRVEFTGTGSASVINQLGARMGGAVKEATWFEPFAARLNNFWVKRGEARLADLRLTDKAQRLQSEWDGAMNFLGGGLDDWAERFGVTLDDSVKGNHRQATDYILDLERQLDDVAATSRELATDLNNYSELTTIMDDMIGDYKTKYIDNNPKWADHLVDGEVPMELLNGGRTVDSMETLVDVLKVADDLGISPRQAAAAEKAFIPEAILARLDDVGGENVGKFLDEAMHSLQGKTAYVLPASPLELIAAASGGPKAMRGVIEKVVGAKWAENFHTAHTMWMLDKVMTPRTAFVVSLDELMRIWHTGGNKAMFTYMDDKAAGLVARVTRAKQNEAIWGKLPNRWKDRLIALEEYPTFYRQLERSFMETNGVGFDELVWRKGRPNDEYFTAARRTAGQLNSDEGFQMYLKGQTAFREWFESSPRAARLRDSEFFDVGTGTRRANGNWSDFYAGYDSVFEKWALGGIKDKSKVAARDAWRKASDAQLAKGSTAAGVSELPEWVLQGFERVTGNKQAGKFNKGIKTVSDGLFQGPVDYRRGFLAEWVRKSEHARLSRLYESQGIKVLSDADLTRAIKTNYPGLPDEVLQPRLVALSQELFEKQGVVSARFVDELVETKVVAEMENMLYSFHMNSRVGRSTKAIAPFGKPWADMWGFWGREIMSRPQLRGYINDTNFANMGNIANKVVDQMPFNPRTTAFMSRLAATDFDLENIADDPLVGGLAKMIGLSSLDVGPAMFLPKGGDNPFLTMVPGFGMLPQAAMNFAFKSQAPDPVDDPLAYQQYLDQWSQFLPGLRTNSGGGTPAETARDIVFSGGALNRLNAGGQAAQGAIFDAVSPSQSTVGQDWTVRIAADRQVQVVFSDPDIWTELADLPLELMDLGISALLDEKLMEISAGASRTANQQELKEAMLEIGVPVRAEFSTQRDDLNSVWMDAVDWMGLEIPRFLQGNTQSAQNEQADWARGRFFDLEDWDRDALIVEHEALAVNMVSMWEWSQNAKDLGIPDSGLPYRSGGSKTDLERQQTYRELGYIQPVSTRAFAERIIGTVLQARVQTARGFYTEGVSIINEQRWEYVVSPEWKSWLDDTAAILEHEERLPYHTGKELWENYSDLQGVFDDLFPESDPIGLPTKQRSWGEAMPSDRESLRSEFLPDDDEGGEAASYQLPGITPQLQRQADALGINISTGMHMADLYQATADEIAENYMENPIFAHIGPEYKAFLQPRSAGHQAAQEFIGRILDHEDVNQESRALYSSALVYLEETIDRRSSGDKSWLDMREIAVDKWSRMAQDDVFKNQDMDVIWDNAYGRSLGAKDWTPDEPAPLRLEDGFNPDASPVFVQRVIDGDTIDVAFRTGGLMPGIEVTRIRMLGYNQPETDTQAGKDAKTDLNTQIQDAIQNGIPISIVRDPRYGNTDMYGRIFAWVYIGEDAVYAPETMIPRR